MGVDGLAPGTRFHDRYIVRSCIKTGGMGAVYEVVDIRTQALRAIKVMQPSMVTDPDLRARFALEIAVTASIKSEHLVTIFEAGIDDATALPFIVMELLVGEDLERIIASQGALPAPFVLNVLGQCARALEQTHAAGIIHRDLKPENIFVIHGEAGSLRVKILDFGIAKIVADNALLSESTVGIGTPLYMSPEQILGTGAIGPATDCYALAQIAYTSLTGEPYFFPELEHHRSVAGLLSHGIGPLPEPATSRALQRRQVSLPRAFDDWFAQSTAQTSTRRFQSALEMVEALAPALGVALSLDPGSLANASSSARPSRVAAGRWSAGVILGAAGALLAVVAITQGVRYAAEPQAALTTLGAAPAASAVSPARPIPRPSAVPSASSTASFHHSPSPPPPVTSTYLLPPAAKNLRRLQNSK